MRAIRGDGNGGYIISRAFAAAITAVTLISMIWGAAMSFSKTNLRPVEMRVEVLESGCVILTNKHAGLEHAFQIHLTDEADRLARIETKLDALLKR